MKTSRFSSIPAAFCLGLCALAPSVALAQGNSGKSGSPIPLAPRGELSAYPTMVQTGTRPTLTWAITYPATFGDLGTINPPGTIIPKDKVTVIVQPIGTTVTACDPNQGVNPLFVDARISLNGGSYAQLFYGLPTDVNPSKVLYQKKLFANNTLDFGGRFVKNNQWSPFYTTRSSNMQVISLVNGASIPTYLPLYQSSKLASYLKNYLDTNGRVKIGALQVLVLMELGHTNRTLDCFDYQDMVLLVTFIQGHPNNGHGNNLDGVDSSNPGQGKGGPTGLNNTGEDPSGGVDDEIK